MIALIGTPSGSLTSAASAGLFTMGAVNRLFGWAALSLDSGVHSRPFQSKHSEGTGPSLPSHQTSPSGSRATLVYSVSRDMVATALGLVVEFVPGTTPKY